MPEMDGLTLVHTLREKKCDRTAFSGGPDGTEDKVKGLDAFRMIIWSNPLNFQILARVPGPCAALGDGGAQE